MATRGEISSMPIGGINLLNGSKYGSHILAKNCPIDDSLAFGNQDIKI
ncbi:hypothetical protein OQ279_17745 [Salinimicrobium sp. MT39]|uniref:Uncharacterized protein n=1 Tax=Salinimicrobium profundisediminis TaxID=2994553 RepID=A0A9X3CZR6_9FLAO|nr:hypothetical protein [Salinimicrobium profundisediminis]